jgi:hypothetical protein
MFGVRSPRRGWLAVAGRRLWWRLPLGGALRPLAQHVAVQSVPQGQLALVDEPEPEPVGSGAIADGGVGVDQPAAAEVTDRIQRTDPAVLAEWSDDRGPHEAADRGRWVITSGGAAGSPLAMTWVRP